MSLKRKVTGLDDRSGVKRCPHCGGSLPARRGHEEPSIPVTDEERQVILRRSLARVCNREDLLSLLAHYQPSLRALVADVYPPSVNAGDPLP
jgi:hypothetical protein